SNVIRANVISGNEGIGVEISGGNNNLLQGNLIGTTASGNATLGNLFSGVSISFSATGNIIGGLNPGEGNVISGNGSDFGDGVQIVGSGTSGNLVQGNFIGTNAQG